MASFGGVIHGRDDELAAIDRLLASGGALVIRGEPGIGKTTLVRAAIARAPHVRSATGVVSESELACAGLHQLDLPVGAQTDLALYTAVLDRLRDLAPVLVTVDDLHLWDQVSRAG